MLERMYVRWAAVRNFKVQTTSRTPGGFHLVNVSIPQRKCGKYKNTSFLGFHPVFATECQAFMLGL